MTVAEAAGISYDQLGDFIGEDGFFSMVFDFKHADLDVASGSEWFKRISWTIPDLRKCILDSQMYVQEHGWALILLKIMTNQELQQSIFCNTKGMMMQ